MGKKKHDPMCHLAASACSAAVNYPLWKASAIHQSGFKMQSNGNMFLSAIAPPYRGVPAVIFGMTWARAAIFFGSDYYKTKLQSHGVNSAISVTLPPLILSSFVQCVNMPIVRASITMQNPENYNNPHYRTTLSTLRYMANEKGLFKLWHGLSAGLAKSVPKYITSVVVKDWMEYILPPAESQHGFLWRAAAKSVIAGVAGAVLTNPMDVIRNEMFKTDLPMIQTIKELNKNHPGWMTRGLSANLIAVSVPITLTIFLTDVFEQATI